MPGIQSVPEGDRARRTRVCGPASASGAHGERRRCIVAGMAHTSTAATAGIGFGTALAITISWSVNKSILWAIVHGICSWLYVIYFALFK